MWHLKGIYNTFTGKLHLNDMVTVHALESVAMEEHWGLGEGTAGFREQQSQRLLQMHKKIKHKELHDKQPRWDCGDFADLQKQLRYMDKHQHRLCYHAFTSNTHVCIYTQRLTDRHAQTHNVFWMWFSAIQIKIVNWLIDWLICWYIPYDSILTTSTKL